MPKGDRTGPDGSGPMSGRGLGYCGGYDNPGYVNCASRGRGAGFGRGFGRRINIPYAPAQSYESKDELQLLKDEARRMKESLEAVNSRINELEKTK